MVLVAEVGLLVLWMRYGWSSQKVHCITEVVQYGA